MLISNELMTKEFLVLCYFGTDEKRDGGTTKNVTNGINQNSSTVPPPLIEMVYYVCTFAYFLLLLFIVFFFVYLRNLI